MLNKNRGKIVININNILFTIMFIIHVTTFVTRIVDIPGWSSICFFIICIGDIFFLSYYIKQKKMNKLLIVTIIFFSYFLIPTIFTCPNELMLCLTRTIRRISFMLLIIYLFDVFSVERVVNILMQVVEVLNYVNLFFMILYPNGMYHSVTGIYGDEVIRNTGTFVRTGTTRVHWLLGHQTVLIKFILPALCISILYSYIVKGSNRLVIRSKLLIFVCLIETIIANSATNYLVIALVCGIYLVQKIKFRIDIKYIFVGILMLYAFFYFTANDEWLNSFLEWLSNIMGRRVIISSRIVVWNNTISTWLDSIILGQGYLNESNIEIWKRLSLGNPHSSFLWILFEGGVIAFAIFVYYLWICCKNNFKYLYNDIAIIIHSIFVSAFIAMITDDYIFRDSFFLILFALSYYIPKFVECSEMKNGENNV